MIDSHTHLSSCAPDDEELVAAARQVGVRRILTVGMDTETCRQALAAAERFDMVFAAIGRHPNVAGGYDDAVGAELRAFAADPSCRAIGETGLDFFRDHASPDDQRAAFRDQIEIARELDKPLVIHTRAADDETIATLREHAGGVTVILHCFSMPDRVHECLEQGWYISFAGNVTYPRNEDLALAAATVPDDRILVETDAPYLTPQPMRKERNQPAYVTETARFVAAQRGQSYEQLDAAVTANAARLFGWDGVGP
ncbi:Putative deoxyribonuclease YcfH [Patulibacter medicamentivorans]|jgi:TatD DNase family protein|uniref:Putative deoxyribonuclease YcfH n=1 Tax=Patulibacter medicamentivorans TaxID=1097667 RepID=H0E1M8_9ACTN|nr:TatD family hydrolase [Patulibacter medicamentivorans]EHN12423.1 Putative deoxyribonuclease YcfH [Patulibacter medicamentivorans]